jgi:hypothetical protein
MAHGMDRTHRISIVTASALLYVTSLTTACGGALDRASDGGLDDGTSADSSPSPESAPYDAGLHDAASEPTAEAAPEASTMDASMDGPVVIMEPLPPPTCTPPSGATFTGSGSVTLGWPGGSPLAGGFISYTTNGTNPSSGSNVYSSPITFGCVGAACPLTEDIRAIVSVPGFVNSTVANCTYTVTAVPGCGVSDPVFTPPSELSDNDLPVSIVSDPGATICYRTDGTAPTCDNTANPAACGLGSVTFTSTSPIEVTGAGSATNDAITNPATGQVTITALACAFGEPSCGLPPEAAYTLQAAAPTMTAPAGGTTVPYIPGGAHDPTIGTATLSTTSDVQLWYTIGAPPAAPPTCSTGIGPIPATGGASSGLVTSAAGGVAFDENVTYQTIACKPGYLPSAVTTIAYDVQLNAPSFSPPGGTYTGPQAVSVVDTANTGASGTEWTCVTTDGSAPHCSPTACSAGTQYVTDGGTVPVVFSSTSSDVDVSGAVLNAVACGASYVESAEGTSGAYTL